ncbi:MAG: DMT family transporter [Candidatus Eisenbacteria bacterium]
MINSREWKAEGLLLLASAIWGFAFVAQRAGMAHVGPFTFNGVRFALGALVLLPFWKRSGPVRARPILISGIAAGTVLFLGASLQQIGIVTTTAGKAGFITGLYVVIVPLLGYLSGMRPGAAVWSGAILALTGLYLLSVTGPIRLAPGDGWVLGSAFFFALHVLLIGRLSGGARLPAIPLAAVQFATVSLLSVGAAIVTETPEAAGIRAAAIPILYGGLLSVGVAYTLQVAGQRHAAPGPAAIILSLEAVFAVLGGRLLLGETISGRGLAGCALMLAGIVCAEGGRRRGRPESVGGREEGETP